MPFGARRQVQPATRNRRRTRCERGVWCQALSLQQGSQRGMRRSEHRRPTTGHKPSGPHTQPYGRKTMAISICAIGVGAALGALLRWYFATRLNASFPQLPPGTLAANILGAYLIGVAMAVFLAFPA